jgi:hypothetical protein
VAALVFAGAPIMYGFFKDFAAPIATIFAAAVAAGITYFFNRAQTRLAETQADVAVENLKLNLFEKRYALYASAKQLVEYLALQNEFEKIDRTKIRTLYVILDEARFFLPDTVRNFLAELHQTSEAFLKVLADRSNLDADDQKKWSKTVDEAAALNGKLRDMYAKLPTVFEEALE